MFLAGVTVSPRGPSNATIRIHRTLILLAYIYIVFLLYQMVVA